jgi:hypothetical protein
MERRIIDINKLMDFVLRKPRVGTKTTAFILLCLEIVSSPCQSAAVYTYECPLPTDHTILRFEMHLCSVSGLLAYQVPLHFMQVPSQLPLKGTSRPSHVMIPLDPLAED